VNTEGTPELTVHGAVASICLRRPSQRNSLHDIDLHTLLEQFAQINADPAVRVLVLRADTCGQHHPVFCAGYHVGGFDSGEHDPQLFEQVPDALEGLRPITLCALGGSVYGGATDLVLACDLRLALAGSVLRMPAAALGLHYYPGGLRRYVGHLGLNLAQRAFLTAEPMAVEILQQQSGLFHQVVETEDFEAAVEALVNKVAALAPLAAQLTKQSLVDLACGRAEPATLRAREAQTLQSQDFAEGRTAMAERRSPGFIGR